MVHEHTRPLKRIFTDDQEEEEDKTLQRSAKRKRDLDKLLSQIQKEPGTDRMRSAQNVTSQASNVSIHSSYESDATRSEQSSNLHISNIDPRVTEHELCLEFGIFGPIASIKIMYPRGSEEITRGRNNGFVAFMNRADAHSALNSMNGKMIQGLAIRIEWGRPILIPHRPAFVLEDHSKRMQRTPGTARSHVPPPSSLQSETLLRQVQIIIPEDQATRDRIHSVAERVTRNGPPFEEFIVDRERGNPMFHFLNVPGPQNAYYSWKKESLAKGDTMEHWSTDSIKKPELGLEWLPPPMENPDQLPSDADSEDEAARERERLPTGQLGPIAKARFKRRLDSMNGERGFIAKCMCMAIDHADACDAVVDLIVAEVLNSDADDVSPEALQKTLARLHVISDILHNSGLSIPNVWKYRVAFESKLRSVFIHVNKSYRKIDSRMGAEVFRRQIDSLLNIWETWMCFTGTFVDELRDVLSRAMDEEQHARMKRLQAAKEAAERAFKAKEKERLEREKEQQIARKWKTVS